MEFYKRISEMHEFLEYMSPLLKVRFRDKLKLDGKKIDYSDFTRFALTKDGYVPVFMTEEHGTVVNVFPLISIGVAEMLATRATFYDVNLATMWLLCLSKDDIFESDFELFQYMNGLEDLQRDVGTAFHISRNLRMTRHFDFEATLKRIIGILNFLYMAKPRVYCELVIDVMRSTYGYACGFWMGHEQFSIAEMLSETFSGMPCISLFNLPFKRISYIIPNTKDKHHITDATGLGITAFLILMEYILGKFGDYGNSTCIDIGLNEMHDTFQKRFKSCLGDDVAGRYYSGKRVDYTRDSNQKRELYLFERGIYCYDKCSYNLGDGKWIYRTLYENEILQKRTLHIKMKLSCSSVSRPYDAYYSSRLNVGESISFFFGLLPHNNRRIITENEEAELKKCRAYAETADLNMKKISELTTDNSRLKDSLEKADSTIEDLKKEIDVLSQKLVEKNDKIIQLSSEVKSVNKEIRSYYNDEIIETVISEDTKLVSIENMIEFLKDFKICVIGGRVGFVDKLTELGLNIWALDTESKTETCPDVDFAVINTKFVSHKVIRLAQSNYNYMIDRFFYYNGTNVDNFIRVCYDFIYTWLEREG